MKYSTPEVVVLGTAATLVLGKPDGIDDNPNPLEELVAGLTPGLDD
jgi:hypothetical protein